MTAKPKTIEPAKRFGRGWILQPAFSPDGAVLGVATSTGIELLDPVADKIMVAAVIVMLLASQTISGWHVVAAMIILLREITVSGLREFLAGVQVSVPVSRLAKWKTAFQMKTSKGSSTATTWFPSQRC